uniref:Uncharacterized protein n=1 Tax=Mycena chlorophos TaxID=658473 RepID=A0ABQ0LHR3_MYCCL|nr:predicted protein [Mycena chlorophos]
MQAAQSLPVGPLDAVAARRREALLPTSKAKGKKVAGASAASVSALYTLVWAFARRDNGFPLNPSPPQTRMRPAHADILDRQFKLHNLLFRIPLTSDPYVVAAPGTPQLPQLDLQIGFDQNAFAAIVEQHMAFYSLSFPAAPDGYPTMLFEILEGRRSGEAITFTRLNTTNGAPLSIALLQRADSKMFTLPVNREQQAMTIVIAPLYGNVYGPTPRHTVPSPCFARLAFTAVPSPNPQTIAWGTNCYPDCPPLLVSEEASSSSGTGASCVASRIRPREATSDEDNNAENNVSQRRPTRRARYEDDPPWNPNSEVGLFVPSIPNRAAVDFIDCRE